MSKHEARAAAKAAVDAFNQRLLAEANAAEEAALDAANAAEDAASDAETDAQIAKRNSVVKRAYKIRYKERAKANGERGKAAKRSNWDWLAQSLAANTLDKKAKLDVHAFEAILDANGVEHSHWNRTSNGWQGRLRMTGRLALQTVVAETGQLLLPDGETLVAPEEFVAKYRN